MRLSELIVNGELIEVRCHECRTKTPLDPGFFLARRGDIEIGQLGESLHCAQCGSTDVEVKAVLHCEISVGHAKMASEV